MEKWQLDKNREENIIRGIYEERLESPQKHLKACILEESYENLGSI